MARLTTSELLTAFQTELSTRFDVDAAIRYFRVGDQTELDATPRYFLEPGSFVVARVNVGSPTIRQEVRLLSESAAVYAEVDEKIAATIATFETLARDAMKIPSMISGAFLESVSTFADAPSIVSTDAAENVCDVFGGIVFNFSIE